MEGLIPAAIAAILFIYMICSILNEQKRVRRHKLCVRKLYASPVFESLTPLLQLAKKRHVEQIAVDKTGVFFDFLSPAGNGLAFKMKEYGYSYLTPDQQDAMRTLLEECLPKLQDHKRYRLNCQRVTLLNGDIEYIYRYIMQNEYKVRLNRAAYYDPTFHAEAR